MKLSTTHRSAALTMAGAATLAIAGFSALGSVFDYPAILEEPTAEILEAFRANEASVVGWFAALVVSAALLAPTGMLLGRIGGQLSSRRTGRWIAAVGITAAVVQVVGLSRWILFVPGISDDALAPSQVADAHHTFELLHTWLGEVLGETIGYALTATFTVLVVLGVTRMLAPRWMAIGGYVAAALIATGVVIPLGVPGAGLTNFAGYVLWCLWLLAMAVVLWRTSTSAAPVRRTAESRSAIPAA